MASLSRNLKELIAERLNVSLEKITDTADLKEELNLDQSDRSKLTAALSKRFDISITNEDTDRFVTTRDIFLYVENKLWWYSL
ncbi:hypothetical protein CLAFUW4_08469 [Fulvia fulva]|uniref:Carrier domain-containing protein n=1 Tax=Passalora fulva TaxID=5499 RepID=A0A9Q8LDF4_PASFU|nr:uncharacterized protein CLAFUR5_08573 [Fulvia fulva]KAK4628791.1 hypothetical protein CLAFUR4_08474 [Fulvia fulva]KAK4630423.1 hypothetical protein CLAFUR0_08469 [Fulvia fulva]UJO15378.1 hypothetical protein CLAFUR5_08573 [Fulvia fulva]WPV12584.1 hypothetical protein CLAFUW4_08469 [Fulvia fulva]WPV27841.1 hypothetical protein CLAFUW7_08469 [Fulvia fulva]